MQRWVQLQCHPSKVIAITMNVDGSSAEGHFEFRGIIITHDNWIKGFLHLHKHIRAELLAIIFMFCPFLGPWL